MSELTEAVGTIRESEDEPENLARRAMTRFASPGSLTDQVLPIETLQMLARHHTWISYQAQNGPIEVGGEANVKDFDLSPARRAGLSPGIWGVTYDPANFVRDAKALVAQAQKLGADHLIIDAEFCMKGGVNADPLAQTIRDGWSKDAAWTTLGAPSNPRTKDNPTGNDYDMDVRAFISRDFDVMPQAYFNAWNDYRPRLCMDYWLQEGFPRSRIHLMIELATEPTSEKPDGHIDGAGWVPLLREAGVLGDYSVFMSQNLTEADLRALDALGSAAPQTPEAQPGLDELAATRDKIKVATFLLDDRKVPPQKWNAVRDQVRELLGITP